MPGATWSGVPPLPVSSSSSLLPCFSPALLRVGPRPACTRSGTSTHLPYQLIQTAFLSSVHSPPPPFPSPSLSFLQLFHALLPPPPPPPPFFLPCQQPHLLVLHDHPPLPLPRRLPRPAPLPHLGPQPHGRGTSTTHPPMSLYPPPPPKNKQQLIPTAFFSFTFSTHPPTPYTTKKQVISTRVGSFIYYLMGSGVLFGIFSQVRTSHFILNHLPTFLAPLSTQPPTHLPTFSPRATTSVRGVWKLPPSPPRGACARSRPVGQPPTHPPTHTSLLKRKRGLPACLLDRERERDLLHPPTHPPTHSGQFLH